jgi:8-oxo-dGTP pyrophosphatase MutT (NUDIX family)
MTTFVTAAFCLVRDGRLLTVRKTGSSRFMLPGGKIDPGESAREAAVREVMEEVGVDVAGVGEPLGRFQDVAANEPDAWVEATVYVTHLRHTDAPAPLAEIAEQRWLGLDDDLPDDLAPLLRNHVVPSLREHLARGEGRHPEGDGVLL